jgi:hypothetical protein
VSRPIPIGEPHHLLERRRATVIAVGLLGFVTGFALAGMLVMSNQSRHPIWFVAIGFGLVSIGVVGVAISRGAVPMPRTPIYSPPTLRLIARSSGAPVTGFLVAFYVLLGFGLLGNLLLPLLLGGR